MQKRPPGASPNFDRVARVYQWVEYICYGPLLQRVRTRLMSDILSSRRAFVFGDGDGRFLASFLQRNREVRVLAVDTSAAMLCLLGKRCGVRDESATERVQTLQASVMDVVPSADTDLVTSHFVLDCFGDAELRDLARSLASALAPGTRWLVSDFALPTARSLCLLARVYLRLLYAGFRMVTGLRVSRLPDIPNALRDAGFVSIRRSEFAAGMLYTELWQLDAKQELRTAWQADESLPHEAGVHSSPTERAHPMERQTAHDAQPDPEPAVPSLPEPDRGVFHHTPTGREEAGKPAMPETPARTPHKEPTHA